MDPENPSAEEQYITLIWDFEYVLGSRPEAAIPAETITEEKPIDKFCRPVTANRYNCNNCANFSPNMLCLVSLMLDEYRQDEEGLCCEALAELQVSEVDDLEESQTELPNVELYSETFVVTGSYQEERYNIKKLFSNARWLEEPVKRLFKCGPNLSQTTSRTKML